MRSLLSVLLLLGACGGDTWQTQDTKQPGTLTYTTVWAFAPDDVWIGGSQVLHYDGSAFSLRGPPNKNLIKFWGYAPNDLWAVDGQGVMRWQGSAWTDVPLGAVTVSGGLSTIFGFSPTDVWAGGDSNGEMVHWNGSAWTKYITQVVEVRSIWGAAPNDVWVVGLLGFSHWNGVTWTKVDVPSAVEVYGLWGTGANDIWAVGTFRTLEHWDGVSWKPTTTEEDHIVVWGSSPTDVWAGGENGEVSHFDGSGWSLEMLGVTTHINAIHGSSATNVWMVGYDIRDRTAFVLKKN